MSARAQPASDAAIRAGLALLLRDEPIGRAEGLAIFREIIGGAADPAQIGALLLGLAIRGERAEVIAGAVAAMREAVVRVPCRADAIDTCGTGGSGVARRNVSTAVALAVAACGVRVAKHGNRGISSPSGSADVLAQLGVDITASPEVVARCVEQVGVGFLFAPGLHPAMKQAASPRRALGLRTIFNLLGPLTNPAGASHVLMGVFHPDLVGIQVRVLQRLGAGNALVVWGRDGMDEISLAGPTLVGELRDGTVNEYEIEPAQFGFAAVDSAVLRVDNPGQSKARVLEALENRAGAARDIVALNAGAALYASGASDSIASGIDAAKAALASGAALARLDQFVATTRRLKEAQT